MEKERLSRAYTSSAAAVKFYGALSPDNSVGDSSVNSRSVRAFSDDELCFSDGDEKKGNIKQSRPFAAASADPAVKSSSHAHHHTQSGKLNASLIEKELSLALDASDHATAAQQQLHGGGGDVGSHVSLASYEDENFHLRPKIVQVPFIYFIFFLFISFICAPLLLICFDLLPRSIHFNDKFRSILFGWTT